jgi:outer membrane autotransporter protein
MQSSDQSLVDSQGRRLGLRSFNRGWVVWGRAEGAWADRSGTDEYFGYKITSGGAVVGADGQVRDWLRLGVALGADRTDLDGDRAGASGDQDAVLVGLYAEAATQSPFYADASLSYGNYDSDAQRTLTLAGMSLPASAGFGGESWLARLAGGYDFELCDWIVGPTAALSWLHLTTDAFTEAGADVLSLAVEEASGNRLLSSLGLRAATRLETGAATVLPRFELAWRHDFDGGEHEVSAAFRDYPAAAFTVTGAGLAEDLLAAEAGVTALVGERLSAYAELGAGVGADASVWGLSAGLQWRF